MRDLIIKTFFFLALCGLAINTIRHEKKLSTLNQQVEDNKKAIQELKNTSNEYDEATIYTLTEIVKVHDSNVDIVNQRLDDLDIKVNAIINYLTN